MLLDAEEREPGWFRDSIFDVCIVGSGPAGMSLAIKLAEKGWTVGLFEGGGLAPSPESRDIYAGENVGAEYFALNETRLRYLGGSSNHWKGWCRPLEAHDFEPLAHSPYSGWPIRKTDLDPYAAETGQIVDLGPPSQMFNRFQDGLGSLVPIQFRWSEPPTLFARKYLPTLKAAKNIHLFLNANVIDLNLSNNRREVTGAVFRSYGRSEAFDVRARYFALCLGGLENPRFLLNANRQVGIGNAYGLVGRFFCEHLHVRLGGVLFDSPTLDAFKRLPLPGADRYTSGWWFLRPTPQFLAANRVSNFVLRVEPFFYRRESGARSTTRPTLDEYPLLTRVAAAIQGKEHRLDGEVSVMAGQRLNSRSRVRLGVEQDRFGMRRIELDWVLTQLDKKTVTTAALELGQQLAHRNVGRLKIDPWVLDPGLNFPKRAQGELGGNHHMCTTRMSDDPKAGVVDRDCRVHSVDNLYLGGSSVFATPGFANPTFTIVQLALRLADHLDSRLRG